MIRDEELADTTSSHRRRSLACLRTPDCLDVVLITMTSTDPDLATICSAAEHLPTPKQELNWEGTTQLSVRVDPKHWPVNHSKPLNKC